MPKRKSPLSAPTRKAPWESPVETENQDGWNYGEGAVLHPDVLNGRRSTRFPRLNITATAEQLGVTKSHLAKVLSGINQPSISLAVKLAEILGTSIDVVIGLHQGQREREAAKSNPKPKRKI